MLVHGTVDGAPGWRACNERSLDVVIYNVPQLYRKPLQLNERPVRMNEPHP